jgi:putative hydrolase of the HAD superfamily
LSPALSAVIVDFAGVLTTSLGRSWDAWNAGQGLPSGHWRTILHGHPEARRLYERLETGVIGQEEWNTRMGALMGVDGHDLMGQAHAEVRPAAAMVEAVTAARTAGYRTALLSNSYGVDPYNPYIRLGVWDLFDVHVISGHEGIAKPHPEIYRRTLDRLDLPGEKCVFVDDRAENLAPAAALGMRTIHATSPETAAAELTAMLHVTCAAPA